MSIFGTDGIRGRAGQGLLQPATVEQLGAAFAGALTGRSRVAIARDTRESGPGLAAAVARGLAGAGADVADLGVLPTPALSWAIARDGGLDGGVMITASHNPWHDNGLKLFGPDGLKASDELQASTERLFGDGGAAPAREAGRIDADQGPAVLAGYRTSLGEAPSGTVVFDDAAGAASVVMADLLGPAAVPVAPTPDGRNINRDVGAVHPEAAAALAVERGAWAGLVVDGDGDRIVIVDERGGVHDGDALLGFLADRMQSRGTLRGGAVVGTVTSNSGLEVWLAERGLTLVRTPVGDRHVAAAMRDRGCNLGGEASGHVLTPDLCPTGDGLRVGLAVLREAAALDRPLSELLGAVPMFPSSTRKLPHGSRPPIESLLSGPAVLPVLEGITSGGGRSLVRYSGTEPYLRIQVEGPDADLVEAWTDRLVAAAGAALGD